MFIARVSFRTSWGFLVFLLYLVFKQWGHVWYFFFYFFPVTMWLALLDTSQMRISFLSLLVLWCSGITPRPCWAIHYCASSFSAHVCHLITHFLKNEYLRWKQYNTGLFWLSFKFTWPWKCSRKLKLANVCPCASLSWKL